MICTMTINGVAVEIKGSAIECFEFMRRMFPLPESRFAQMEQRAVRPGKICNPLARHLGNCGAEDCPIMGMCSHKFAQPCGLSKFCYECDRFVT